MREKINKIKWWLQRYGERDDDTFSFEFYRNEQILSLSLQMNYDKDGEEYDSSCLFKTNGKLHAEYIEDRTEAELDETIDFLFIKYPAFCEWMKKEGWYEAADEEYDNFNNPSHERLTLDELYSEWQGKLKDRLISKLFKKRADEL